jgi:DNA-binding NtrC family response regulator
MGRTEPDKGRILVINDVPGIRDNIPLWQARPMYDYTFVDSVHEAAALLEHTHFDAVVYGSDLRFLPGSLSYFCQSSSRAETGVSDG